MRLDRRDKCKCGRFICWDTSTNDNHVSCKHCGTKYKIDCDSVLVFWLVEKCKKETPWTTEAR